jgi:hypothetical protein
LHLAVNETGALNVRTLGICVLPFAMFMDGFSGEVNFQKASGCIFLSIVPMSSGVPVSRECLAFAVPVNMMLASAPPLSSGQQTPMEVVTYGSGVHDKEPWVTAMSGGVSVPRFAKSSATIEELDGLDDMMISGVPACLESRLASMLPLPTSFEEQAVTMTSGVPASLESSFAAALPINLRVAQLDAPGVLTHIVREHMANNHNWLTSLVRGVDPSKDLSWMVFGFNLATKAYSTDDDLDFSAGPSRVDLAKKLLASLSSIDRSQLSPNFRVILSCFQDPSYVHLVTWGIIMSLRFQTAIQLASLTQSLSVLGSQ